MKKNLRKQKYKLWHYADGVKIEGVCEDLKGRRVRHHGQCLRPQRRRVRPQGGRVRP